MNVLEISGVRIGEGRPKAIVSLMDTDTGGLADRYERAVQAGADLLEWRADFWPSIHEPNSVAETCLFLSDHCSAKAPFIFTCRTKGQGGQVEMDVAEYAELLRRVITLGKPDLVDIELGMGDEVVGQLVDLAHEYSVAAIVSYHDFSSTPSVDEMVDMLLHMTQLGADIPKLAVMPGCVQDPKYLMQATSRVRELVDVPLLTLSMGIAGQHTRLSGEVFGSALTFCALGKLSAPGQVELAEAIALMDAIHRQREQKA